MFRSNVYITKIFRIFNTTTEQNAVPYLIRPFCSKSPVEDDVAHWILTLDETNRKKIRYIQNEMSVASIQGERAPDSKNVTVLHYQKLLTLSTNQRKSYYRFLQSTLLTEMNSMVKVDIKKKLEDERPEKTRHQHGHINYEYNKIFHRFSDSEVDRWKNRNVYRHMQLGAQRLIFDCGFESAMNHREISETAAQLKLSFTENRNHLEPYAFHFCNLNPSSMLCHMMTKEWRGFNQLPIYMDNRHFCDIYPKDKITILTQSSPNPLKEFDPDAYYVFGALVDLTPKKQLILGRAKEMNIQTARIPFDLYGKFRKTDCLSFSHLTKIMLEMKRSNDWSEAFKYVPLRFRL